MTTAVTENRGNFAAKLPTWPLSGNGVDQFQGGVHIQFGDIKVS